jgi:hypothetical protein
MQVQAPAEACEADCVLEILVGAISGVVAVHTWTVEGDVVIAMRQPPTPAVVGNAGGTYYLFRHPGGHIRSDYLHVPYQGGRTILQILGDGGSVNVPLSALEIVQDWPHSDNLPVIDLQRLAEGWT